MSFTYIHAMTSREKRLSLNKGKKMSNEGEIDFDISLNQEGNYERDNEIDFSLDLEKDENDIKIDEIGKQCITSIKQLMDERHELAEIQESMKYGLQTSKYPYWMRISLSCKPSLSYTEDHEKLQEVWQKNSKSALQDAINNTVEYVANEIKGKEKFMQQCRMDTFTSLGLATKGAGDKKKEIDSEIRKMNSEFATKINEYKARIRSTIPERDERGRGRRPSRYHRRGRGRRFNPYY